MYTLLCNLDPGWDFENLLHGYSVDLFADPDFGVWQVGKPAAADMGPWGDWPRRIDSRHLNAELTETLYLHREMPCLLLFNLPTLSSEALQQHIQTLGQVLTTAPNPRQCNILILPAPSPDAEADFAAAHPELLTIATTTWVDHLVLLPAVDPIFDSAPYRLYGLRLLMTLFAQEEALNLIQFRRTRVVSFRMISQPTVDRLSDTASQRWRMMAQNLLSASETLRHAAPDHGITQWEQDTAVGFDAIETLRTSTDAAPPPCPKLKLPCPWFFKAWLPEHLKAEIVRFYQKLEHSLEQRFETLNSAYQHLQQEQLALEAAFLETLQEHTALTLGLHDDARAVLEQQKQARIADQRQTLLTEEQQILLHLRGDLALETRRDQRGDAGEMPAVTGELTSETRQGVHLYGGTNRHYRRPLFQEDVALEDELDKAQRAAARLASFGWFAGGLLLTVALALIPILALRLPGWQGWPVYSSDPKVWGLDVGWLAAFGLSYLLTSLYQVYRQRRSLRQRLANLKQISATVYARSHQALSDTFRYQRLTLAMRRLLALEEQIDRILDERQTVLSDLAVLENTLSNQIEHYQTQGIAPVTTALPPNEADELRNRLQAQQPGVWFRKALEHWPPRPPMVIEVSDQAFNMRYPLPTPYLRDGAELILTRILPD